jgi:hypothetical protein
MIVTYYIVAHKLVKRYLSSRYTPDDTSDIQKAYKFVSAADAELVRAGCTVIPSLWEVKPVPFCTISHEVIVPS